MILIDALHINNGGGKVLLDYLIDEIEKTPLSVYYLLDERIRHKCPDIKSGNPRLFMKAGLKNRFLFYLKNRNKFSVVFCFGNFPPFLRPRATVYTYFHQLLFLSIPRGTSLLAKITIYVKSSLLNILRYNTDYFIVQSEVIRDGLIQKYHLSDKKVLTIPFFPPLTKTVNLVREKDTFVYASSGASHKNQIRLISAFSQFYRTNKIGTLYLTVGSQFGEVIQYLEEAKRSGIQIVNSGFVDRNQLGELYKRAEYLIFPSLAESFGLGLIEAIEQGCKVIASDLPYTYEVCEPSLVFDPESTQSIVNAFEIASTRNLKPSVPLIKNNIQELIRLLSD